MARITFNQAVDRIRELDASEGMTAFEMGDVVLEQAPMGKPGQDNGATAILGKLATETGVDYEVLRQRRVVSNRIPKGTRVPFVAWAVYRQIAFVDDDSERKRLLKLVATKEATQLVDGEWRPTKQKRWTVDAILTHIKGKSANPALGSIDLLRRAFKEAEAPAISTVLAEQPEIKQQAVLQHSIENTAPDTMSGILESPQARRNVYSGLHQHEQKAVERTERLVQADPIARRLDQQQAMLDLERWGDQLRHHVERLRDEILPRLGQIPDSDPLAFRRFLSDMLIDLDEAIQPVRTFVETGGTDIDHFLKDVLSKKG